MEEKDPAARDERGRAESRCPVGEPTAEQRHEREARDGERGGDEPERAEAEPEMGDGKCEHEVEWGAASLAGHVLDDAGETVPADEERERLVLMGRPRHQLVDEERRRRQHDRADAEREPIRAHERARRGEEWAVDGGGLGTLCHGASPGILAGRLAV